jgi:hypothetical protein
MTIEYWDVAEHAGFGSFRERDGKRINWTEEENGLKLLEWDDEEFGGEHFKPWTPFEHPQLGPVETGGWRTKFLFQNPPPRLLDAEITNVIGFPLWLAAQTPLVKVTRTEVNDLGGGLYEVKALIENRGFLPSYASQWAKSIYIDRPVVAKILLEGDVELVAGKKRVVVGDLEGSCYRMLTPRAAEDRTSRQVTWVVRSSDPAKAGVTVVSVSQKGGTDRKQVKLT